MNNTVGQCHSGKRMHADDADAGSVLVIINYNYWAALWRQLFSQIAHCTIDRNITEGVVGTRSFSFARILCTCIVLFILLFIIKLLYSL